MTETKPKDTAAQAEQKARFIVLGVFRRDLLFIISTEDAGEAEEIAKAGVAQSKFSDTFVLEVSSHFNEQALRWKNPDGVDHAFVAGPRLNPEAGEQPISPEEATSSEKDLTSKRDNIAEQAAAQRARGELVDTGMNPDMTRSGESTGAFDLKTGEPVESDSRAGAKSGVQSSSDLKGTTNSEKK